MSLKKSRETWTKLRLENFQECRFRHGHYPEQGHGLLLLLLHLPQLLNTRLGEGDLPLAVPGQEHVHLQGGHHPEHALGLLLLLHLPQLLNTGLGEGDLPLAVHGQAQEHLQGGHSALLLGGLLSYAVLGIISLAALGNECLAPWGKNAWLLLGRMPCCLWTNALLPRRGFSSLALQRATQLGSQRTIQLGSLEVDFQLGSPDQDFSAWLPR